MAINIDELLYSGNKISVSIAIKVIFSSTKSYDKYASLLKEYADLLNVDYDIEEHLIFMMTNDDIIIRDRVDEYEKLHIIKSINAIKFDKSSNITRLPPWLLKFNLRSLMVESDEITELSPIDLQMLSNMKELDFFHAVDVYNEKLTNYMKSLGFVSHIPGVYTKDSSPFHKVAKFQKLF